MFGTLGNTWWYNFYVGMQSCIPRKMIKFHAHPQLEEYVTLVTTNQLHCSLMVRTSLVPRPFEEEEKGPGTHCVRMHYFPNKSWEFVFLSVNMNLVLRNMPKNHFCWQYFGLKMPVVTNLAITSE